MYEEKSIKNKIKLQNNHSKKSHNRHYKNRFFFFIEEKNGKKYINFHWGQITLRTLLIIGCIFLLAFIEIKTVFKRTTDNSVFNDNLTKLSEIGTDFYTKDNIPVVEGDSVSNTLSELIAFGYSDEIYDKEGNACNKENSYIILTKEATSEYSLKSHLECGNDNATLKTDLICDENICKIK